MIVKVKNTKWHDHLHGGKADGNTPSDYDPDELNIGSKVQREHTSDMRIATEIGMDHEEENPTYYDELIMSGIADEQDAIDTFNKVATDDDKKKAIDKIQQHLDKEKEKLDMKEHRLLKFEQFVNEDSIFYDDNMMIIAGKYWDGGTPEEKLNWIKLIGYEFTDHDKIAQRSWGSFKEKSQEELAQLFFEQLGFNNFYYEK
jgi:hypothetical protein